MKTILLLIILLLSTTAFSQRMLYVPVDKTDSIYVYFARDNDSYGPFNIMLQGDDIYFFTNRETAEGNIEKNNFYYAQSVVREDILKSVKKKSKKLQ